LVLGLCTGSLQAARIITVDDDGPADFNTIQAAINDSNDGDTIIVADGIYTGDGNRDIDYGGRAITARSENGPNNCIIDCEGTYEDNHRGFYFHSGEGLDSILSGLTITNGYAPIEEFDDGFFTWESSAGGAIFCRGSSPTITKCRIVSNTATAQGTGLGGGIHCWDADPKIIECSIQNNSATDSGGGIYCGGGNGIIKDCIITGNSASWGGGIKFAGSNTTITESMISSNSSALFGGGISVSGSSSKPVISYCTISDNSCSSRGGGILCLSASPEISNCLITGNYGSGGGGIYCYNRGSDPTISNCLISNNLVHSHGGGILCLDGSPTIMNCIISDNLAPSLYSEGGGIYCYDNDSAPMIANSTIVRNSATWRGGGICCRNSSSPTIVNCIMWDNTSGTGPEIAIWTNLHPAQLTINYSDVKGGQSAAYVGAACTLNWGLGNIDAAPCFADTSSAEPDEWDLHLQSQAGRWDPNSQTWVIDANTSVAIDAGDMASPIGYEPFPNGGLINMGAYGGTVEASKSYFGKPPCEIIVAGDVNGDCEVNFLDFRLMALHWCEDNRQ
jgi:predicted outer membrane repeat protein